MTVTITKNNQGLIHATEHLRNSGIIAVNIAIKNGSNNETQLNNGISHFIEHMLFKGTSHRTALEIAGELDSIGGMSNAYTSKTETVYHVKILKEYESRAYDIISDILNNPVFCDQEINLERNVILQEMQMDKDSPENVVFENMFEDVFKGQPFGLKIIGERDNIISFQHKDLEQFYKNYYTAKRTVISVVGDFDKQKYTNELIKRFSNLEIGATQIPSKLSTFLPCQRHTHKTLEQVHVVICFPTVSYRDEKYYTLQILSTILGGGMSSRLFQEIREKRGLAYNISSFTYSFDCNGVFGIYASFDPMNIDNVNNLIIKELHLLIKGKFFIGELAKAKSQFKTHLLVSAENSDIRAERLSTNIMRHNRNIPVSEVIRRLDEVTETSLMCLAKETFLTSKISYFSVGQSRAEQGYQRILTNLKK